MRMKCTYRLLVLLGTSSCLLVLLGIIGDVTRIFNLVQCIAPSYSPSPYHSPLVQNPNSHYTEKERNNINGKVTELGWNGRKGSGREMEEIKIDAGGKEGLKIDGSGREGFGMDGNFKEEFESDGREMEGPVIDGNGIGDVKIDGKGREESKIDGKGRKESKIDGNRIEDLKIDGKARKESKIDGNRIEDLNIDGKGRKESKIDGTVKDRFANDGIGRKGFKFDGRGREVFASDGKEKKQLIIDGRVKTASHSTTTTTTTTKSRMVLAVVCCGDRLNETKTMLKSAAALSHSALTMIVFTEDKYKEEFTRMHTSWPHSIRSRITLDLHSITFPSDQDAAAWRKLFKPCASQRLFMPSILQDIDALLYVDTDTLFLSPVEEVWSHFTRMNSSQMAAMAPEHEDLATGWYNRFAKHPYYGRLGVNSGVMLMNLTRLRSFGWEEYVVPIYKSYRLSITWGDQDIINIIFHFHPDKLYVYGCEYNLRPDHCMYMSVCKKAERRGIKVLHGSRGTFHTNKQPAFRAVYRAWEQYGLGDDLRQDLYYPMQRYLLKTSNTTCGKIHSAFLKGLSSIVRLR